MSRSLEGKVALVTGGSRNVGRETALALAAMGADVVVTYRQQEESAQATVRDMEAQGVRGAAIRVDLTGTAELDSLFEQFVAVLRNWGRMDFDILVNNAGILRLSTFDKETEDDLEANFQTNYKSVFFLTQGLANSLADSGRIVMLGSGTSRIVFAPLASYGPIKAAVQSLTLYLASFLGARGITVNAVAPGGLDDDFNARLFETMPVARDYIINNTALKRMGCPTDVAGVIAFLCTPAAGFVSGAVIPIDGGYHL
jgi:NAD(P)-dependent dehydrogenase (short-subunit alcohol dehydrogenase family)